MLFYLSKSEESVWVAALSGLLGEVVRIELGRVGVILLIHLDTLRYDWIGRLWQPKKTQGY